MRKSEIDRLIDRVRRPLRAGMSKRELARRAGIPWSNLYNVDDPNWNPTRRTLEALLKAVKEADEQSRPLASAGRRDSVRVA